MNDTLFLLRLLISMPHASSEVERMNREEREGRRVEGREEEEEQAVAEAEVVMGMKDGAGNMANEGTSI